MATVVPTSIKVRAAANEDELRRAHELMAATHQPDASIAIDWFESSGATYPGFLPEHTRIACTEGEVAGALRLTTEIVRLGEARLKTGGLGWVATDPEHRHKGVATALLQSTLDYMRGHGYHVSMLFGIPNFYHRFGYATTLADYFVTLDAVEAPTLLSGKYRTRPVKPGDIRAIQRMHAANDVGVACSLIRTAAHFTNKWHRFQHAHVFTDDQGKVVGYVLAAPEEDVFAVQEVGIGDPEVAIDILAFCAQRAQEAFKPRLRFAIPPEHLFAHVLRRYDSTHETRLCRQRGGMMTFVDLCETLENLIPEWEHLVAESAIAGERCEVTLLVDGKSFRLRSNRGAIDVSEGAGRNKFGVTPDELMHLVTGYTHLDDIFYARRRIVSADGQALLAALFPKRNPYVHLFDRF